MNVDVHKVGDDLVEDGTHGAEISLYVVADRVNRP